MTFNSTLQNYITYVLSITNKKNVFEKTPIKTLNYRNRFVTQYITYLNIREVLSGTISPLSAHDRLLWFEILVGADLLPSTGFKMNFLVNPVEGSRSAPSKISNQNQSVTG